MKSGVEERGSNFRCTLLASTFSGSPTSAALFDAAYRRSVRRPVVCLPTLLSWKICHRPEAWRLLPKSGADIALLQEACEPPEDVAKSIEVDTAPWETAGTGVSRHWRTAVVRLSERVQVERLESLTIAQANRGEFAVSRVGTISAARVTPEGGEPFVVASMYGVWEKSHPDTESSWIYADASVHRLISDLSVFVGRETNRLTRWSNQP